MDWLLLGALGIIWAAYVFPFKAVKGRSRSSIEEFERSMGLLEQTEKATGRWIVAPRKGEPFVGRRERARERCRARRRRVFVTLLEAMGITFLIGLFPPLHGMWIATGVLAALLAAYMWMLVEVKREEEARPRATRAAETTRLDVPLGPAAPKADGALAWLSPSDIVHVKIRTAAELGTIGV
jgi:hypothetical protein